MSVAAVPHDVTIEDVKRACCGSVYFAFQKGDKFFLYRKSQPQNVCVVHSKTLTAFARRVSKIVGVVIMTPADKQ